MSFPFILIWATQMLFSKTQGEVTTAANVNAIPGLPFTLSCNVSTATGERVRQVRWLDPGGQVLTAYEPGDPPTVSLGRPDVWLSPRLPHAASAITVATAGPAHQGCYVCEFHVYPSGRQQGRTCLTLTATVLLEGGGVALSGGVARLLCLYSGDPAGVRQVLWSRRGRGGGDPTPLGSYSVGGGALVGAALGGRGQLSASPGESRLTLQPLEPQDEACYTCQLHTFPQGRLQGSTCLVVYVLPDPELTSVSRSSGLVEANCTTLSRPASNITWSVAGDNHTLGPPTVSYEQQGGGTTRVTSTLLVQSELLQQLSVKCLIHHPGLDQPLSLTLSGEVRAGQGVVVAVAVASVSLVLLLLLCVCLCRVFFCKGD
ncbi:uncharacterized protein LOC115542993 isoform X1 [Gadus morhua]|uniref:uncharacterized protein LOC115542993 isoform X1 n=1 Tax=Gadus morhua TaxID=8049 RepID=UPI0011B7DEAC|nr:uncharacterized protein LOC115542993 isoform X1 [Gadus morhua]XP_030211384.1 uncharacterized protein LOC115542993 isoform X1 [Gadus morhua]XP_030211385.1 uncharacterized protein LOC115542993 isoform X1 [Gadus morhua]XP_030211386.1 uncharacterized protein LOC115542993 isoform X1 [Gadus morhua]